MHEWFAQKCGYDANLSGIVDECAANNGHQYNIVHREGAKHGSIQVASILHYFFTRVRRLLGSSKVLHFNSDSCTWENKNDILVKYFMLRVAHRCLEEIIWSFREVGHTKFRPDEEFGITRQYVDDLSDVVCKSDMVNKIGKSAQPNSCHLFPVSKVQYWKRVGDYFKFLTGLKNFFTYKIPIRAVVQDGARNVFFDVYRSIAGESPDFRS